MLEVVLVPVSDIDCARSFYEDRLGFNVDHDNSFDDGTRWVQLTAPGLSLLDSNRKGIDQLRASLRDVTRECAGFAAGRT